ITSPRRTTVEKSRTRQRWPAVTRSRSITRTWSPPRSAAANRDRKSTRLNSSHVAISYAVFCLKKKTEAAGAARLGSGAAVAPRHRRLPVLGRVHRPRSSGYPPVRLPRRGDPAGADRGGGKHDQ